MVNLSQWVNTFLAYQGLKAEEIKVRDQNGIAWKYKDENVVFAINKLRGKRLKRTGEKGKREWKERQRSRIVGMER